MTEHRFTKGVLDYAPGMMWMLRNRIEEHRKRFGGRPPLQFLLHGPSFTQLLREHADGIHIGLSELPLPVERMAGCRLDELDRILIIRCRCGRPMAEDQMITCDGNTEEL